METLNKQNIDSVIDHAIARVREKNSSGELGCMRYALNNIESILACLGRTLGIAFYGYPYDQLQDIISRIKRFSCTVNIPPDELEKLSGLSDAEVGIKILESFRQYK